MAKITLHPDRQSARDIDIALRKFKRAVEADGTMDALRDKQQYTKPSIRRKLALAAAKGRLRREQAKHKLPDKQF